MSSIVGKRYQQPRSSQGTVFDDKLKKRDADTYTGRMGKKLDPWIYNARLIKGVDGDTADAWIDLGFSISVKKRIRFVNVDTWESRTRDLEEKKKGLEAKAYTLEMLSRNDGKFKVKSHGVGKYGRLLGEIFIEGEEKSLNELLIENGHAYEYDGGKKKVFNG